MRSLRALSPSLRPTHSPYPPTHATHPPHPTLPTRLGRPVMALRPARENTRSHVDQIRFLTYNMETMAHSVRAKWTAPPRGSGADLSSEQLTLYLDFTVRFSLFLFLGVLWVFLRDHEIRWNSLNKLPTQSLSHALVPPPPPPPTRHPPATIHPAPCTLHPNRAGPSARPLGGKPPSKPSPSSKTTSRNASAAQSA